MRLRNLFMILLLCMTVGVFSACTGDDGATGPQGPQGPQGPAGDPGEGAEDITGFYDFLKTWGSETGEVACSDPLLKGMVAFPGPAELDAITAVADGGEGILAYPSAPAELNNPITVACSANLFESITVPARGNPTVPTAGATSVGFVFVKTGRTALDPEVVSTAQGDIDPAYRRTTTKMFVGGQVYADLNASGGTDEPFERSQLYTACGDGTAPSAIKGDWRGVKIAENVKAYRSGARVDITPGDTTDTADTSEVNITTTKVCVRLDVHPGIVKCFIDIDHSADNTKDSKVIAYYDAESGATSVKKLVNTNFDATTAPTGTLSSAVANDSATTLFGIPQNDGTLNAGDLSAEHTEQLCNLFEEGLK